jgi:transcription antitermination factor NusG
VSLLDVGDQDQLGSELEQIRRLQVAGASFEPLVTFAPGDPVRVTAGVFSGYSGRVIREKGRERLVIDISLLRRSVAVELEPAVVESAVFNG